MTAVRRTLPGTAAAVFALLADVRHHERWIPLTHGRFPDGPHGALPPGPLPVGTRFTMLSRPGVVDRMEVTALHSPGPDGVFSTTLRKAGPLLLGTAGIEVRATGPRSCEATWWEDVHLAGPLPSWLGRALVAPFLTLMLRHALSRVARELRRRS